MSEIIPDTGPELSDDQMNTLLDGGEIDTGAPAAVPAATTPATPETPAPGLEYEFTANGKPVKVPASDPRVAQWLRQGYDYNQRMAEFKTQQAEIEQRAAKAAEFEKRYGEVDKYIAQNPGWWDHVQASWQQRAAMDPNSPIAAELNQLKATVEEVKGFKTQLEQERDAQIKAQEDQALDSEIKSLRESYPDIDFSAADPEGKTLEARVLEHAVKTRATSFRMAFRDLHHEHLVKREAEKAKELVIKDIQAKKKQGFLGTSPVPRKGVTESNNRDQSYYDAMLEGLDELSG